MNTDTHMHMYMYTGHQEAGPILNLHLNSLTVNNHFANSISHALKRKGLASVILEGNPLLFKVFKGSICSKILPYHYSYYTDRVKLKKAHKYLLYAINVTLQHLKNLHLEIIPLQWLNKARILRLVEGPQTGLSYDPFN